jgi:putative flippase GtrA
MSEIQLPQVFDQIHRPIMPAFMQNRFARFILVGGLNALFGFAIYSLLALTHLSTWIVLIVSNMAGITFNFFTTGGLVFRNISPSRVPRFLVCYGVIFAIYLQLIRWLSPLLGGRIWAMAVIIAPMALLTYFLQSWFVFRDDR